MADLAPARCLEGQPSLLRAEIVAGEAGESAMAVMWEGVAGRGRDIGTGLRRVVLRRRRPLPPGTARLHQRSGRLARGGLLERRRRVEGKRWAEPAPWA